MAATKLTRIPEADKIRVDGHYHIYTNYRPEANKWYYEPGSRSLTWLTGQVLDKGINALGITNFNDGNYEFWTGQVKELPNTWSYYQDDRLTVVETPEQERVYYWKSEEVATRQGHTLYWGGKRGRKHNIRHGRSLTETLDKAENDDAVTKIADHPYSLWHGLRKGLKEGERRFDSYEWNASTDGNSQTETKARQDKKPVVASSDAHRPKDIGKSYTEFDGSDLSYDNGTKFMKSVKEKVKKKKFKTKKQKVSLGSTLHHVFMNFWYKGTDWIRKKLGFGSILY